MDEKAAFYKKLKQTLNEETKFPTKYLFKFIVPNEKLQISQVENLFNNMGAVIAKKNSKTGKFTSVSIQVIMKTADEIILKYKEAAAIEGIISL